MAVRSSPGKASPEKTIRSTRLRPSPNHLILSAAPSPHLAPAPASPTQPRQHLTSIAFVCSLNSAGARTSGRLQAASMWILSSLRKNTGPLEVAPVPTNRERAVRLLPLLHRQSLPSPLLYGAIRVQRDIQVIHCVRLPDRP